MEKPPLFFSQIAQFQQQIPTASNRIEGCKNGLLTPFIESYLSYYQLDFVRTGIAQTHIIWKTAIGNYQIVQQYWQPKEVKGTIIVVHGYMDHVGLYGKLINLALQQHYAVLCFDLPGHGLSSGTPAVIDSFSRYTQVFAHILEDYQSNTNTVAALPFYAIGQSTGCAVIAQHVLETSPHHPLPLTAMIFLSPLVRSKNWKKIRWLYFSLRPFIESIKRRFSTSSHDKSFKGFLRYKDPLQTRRIALSWLGAMEEWYQFIHSQMNTATTPTRHNTPPLSMIQGTADITVDWHYNLRALAACFPNNHISYIPQARHHLVKESDEFWQQAAALIQQIINVDK